MKSSTNNINSLKQNAVHKLNWNICCCTLLSDWKEIPLMPTEYCHKVVSQNQYVDMSVLGSVLNSVVHLYKMTIK